MTYNQYGDTLERASKGAAIGTAAGTAGALATGMLPVIAPTAIMGAVTNMVMGSGDTDYVGSGYYTQNDKNATTRTGRAQYNRYNDAVNYLNNYMKSHEGYNSENDLLLGNHGYDQWKKDRGIRGTKRWTTDFYQYNPNTGNRVLDDYTSRQGGFNSTDWTDYANQQSSNFVDRYSNLSDDLKNSMLSNTLANYGAAGREGFVNTNDASHYADAKLQLDNQLARGYLSNVGYQQALQKLNNQIATNKANLAQLAQNKHDTWENDLAQAWAKNVMDSDTGLDNDAWIKYYDNYMNYDGNNMNNLFDKAHGATSDYANAFISDDLMNAALVDQSLYNPDQYIAWGAANQGAYNPFDYLQSRKRRMTWDNIGEA